MSWMVRQRVDFYVEEFRPIRLPAPARALLRDSGLALGLMALLSIAAVVNGRWHQQHIIELESGLTTLQRQLLEEERRVTVPSVDNRLQRQVDEAERSVLFATQRLNYLQNNQQGFTRQNNNQRPFLALMQQLGETPLDSVWLSSTRLSDRGANIALGGLLQRPDAVSDYLTALNRLPAWQGVVFQQIVVEEQGAVWRFALDTLVPSSDGSVSNGIGSAHSLANTNSRENGSRRAAAVLQSPRLNSLTLQAGGGQ